MLAAEFGLADKLWGKFAAALHDRTKHLVVAAAGKENVARIELEERAADGPGVDAKVVR